MRHNAYCVNLESTKITASSQLKSRFSDLDLKENFPVLRRADKLVLARVGVQIFLIFLESYREMKLLAAFLTQSVFSNNEDPTRIHVDEGGTVTLPCSIQDNFLSPVVEWRHSGQRIAKRLEERVKLVKSSPLVDRVKVSLVPGSADLSLSNASGKIIFFYRINWFLKHLMEDPTNAKFTLLSQEKL